MQTFYNFAQEKLSYKINMLPLKTPHNKAYLEMLFTAHGRFNKKNSNRRKGSQTKRVERLSQVVLEVGGEKGGNPEHRQMWVGRDFFFSQRRLNAGLVFVTHGGFVYHFFFCSSIDTPPGPRDTTISRPPMTESV